MRRRILHGSGRRTVKGVTLRAWAFWRERSSDPFLMMFLRHFVWRVRKRCTRGGGARDNLSDLNIIISLSVCLPRFAFILEILPHYLLKPQTVKTSCRCLSVAGKEGKL